MWGNQVISVLVVDDHELVRAGISGMLGERRGLEVIGEADSGESAIELAAELEPDVMLMDVKMPGIGGLEATRRIARRYPHIRILAVTVCEDEPFPSRLLQAGASGYLTKGADVDEMVRAIRTVYAGQRYLSSSVARAMALRPYKGEGQAAPFDVLSERELQIMMMIVHCHKVQDISDRLCLSPKTVNTYRYRIFEKLGVAGDVEMTLMAVRHGMLDAEMAS